MVWYIFDMDGTLANVEHRLPLLDGSPASWDRFSNACDGDLPNRHIVGLLEALIQSGAVIRIFTGRSESARAKTVQWLLRNTSFRDFDKLKMRAEGDTRRGAELKREWYLSIPSKECVTLGGVFEDDVNVCAMWRDLGVECFQVTGVLE